MGRIVVITGGTSGIGLKLKELFEKNGDTVCTFSLDETGESNHYNGSVDHEIKVKQVFNDIHERFGKIDILINNAGFGMSGITELLPIENMRKLMDVNYFGTIYCTRAALQYMNAGAKIINMSSAMALFPVPFRSIYGSAKAAVLSLSFGLKMELASGGIDVTAICPGDVKTNFTANRIKDFTTTERYGDRLKTATENSDAQQDKRMPAEYVAEKIFNIANKKKFKPFYIIGGKYKFLYFLTRLTPKSLLLKCTNKKLGGQMTEVKNTKAKTVQPKPEIMSEPTEHTFEQAPTTISEQTVVNEAQENIETVSETLPEVAVESAHQEETTENTTQEEHKETNNLNNLLNKMTGLKKPSESTNNTTNENE